MLTNLEFCRIAKYLGYMKIIHGPEWLNATLKRHKDIYLALQDFEKRYIIDLESNLIARSGKDE